MVILNNDNKERLNETLGEGNDKFYVYMLCTDKNEIFYIGKGCGCRIFQHEKVALSKLIGDDDWEKLSAKEQKIIHEMKDYKRIIVKWGLTENEAFMAESALINLAQYIAPNKDLLTNIVNGMATEREKEFQSWERDSATEAMTVEDFLKDVAPPSVNFADLGIHANVCFLKNKQSIHTMYEELAKNPDISKDDYIYQASRGFWKIGKDRLKDIEYVVSIYNDVVVGIFKVNPSCWGKMRDFPEDQIKEREKCLKGEIFEDDHLIIRSRGNYATYNQKGGTRTKERFEKVLERWGFTKLEETIDPKLSELIGKRLNDAFLNDRTPIRYKFEKK